MFVLLAVAFGLGFVLFGVGSGSTGISQAMQSLFSSSSGGGSSLSSLDKKASDNPKQPAAWRNLVTKLEQDQKIDRAITALEHYVSLQPKDQQAIQELASLYQRRAQDYNNIWSQALGQLEILAPGVTFEPKSTSIFGKAYANQSPITDLVVKRLDATSTAASEKLGLLMSKAQAAYKRLAKIAPTNATYQFQYASIAQSLGHKAIAIKAYKTFLKLAPHDSLAPTAKQQLKVLSPPTAKK